MRIFLFNAELEALTSATLASDSQISGNCYAAMDQSIEAFKQQLSGPTNADISQSYDFIIIRILSHYSSLVLHRSYSSHNTLSAAGCMSATRGIANELRQLMSMQPGYVNPILAVSRASLA